MILSLALLAAMLCGQTMQAQEQEEDKLIFNHLGVGVEAGTAGFGLEVAAPLTKYLIVRTGFTSMPTIAPKFDVDYKYNNLDYTTKVKGKLHMTDWKLLVDYFPFRKSSFHVTTGFFVGKSKLVTAQNISPLEDIEEGEGIEVGDYLIEPVNGIVRAQVKVASFKPYLGVGLGRALPKNRLSFNFDMGVQFWGTPLAQLYSPEKGAFTKVVADDFNDKDVKDGLKTLNKVTVWPTLSFKLAYRIF